MKLGRLSIPEERAAKSIFLILRKEIRHDCLDLDSFKLELNEINM